MVGHGRAATPHAALPFALSTCLAIMLVATPGPAAAQSLFVTPTPANVSVSADTALNGGTGAYTALTGPVLTEPEAGTLGTGTIILDLGSSGAFEFNPGSGSVTVSPSGCGLDAVVAAKSTTQIQVSITGTSSAACTLTFAGLQVRPVSGLPPLPSLNLTNTGSAAGAPSPGNYGTITEVPGAPILTFETPPAPPTAPLGGGSAFATQPVVKSWDQFHNLRGGDVVTLAVQSGPGSLTCSPVTNQQVTGASGSNLGLASFGGCSLDKAGAYVLRATTVGQTGTVPTASLTIIVGSPARLAFTASPSNPTTTSLGTIKVQIQDLGGNRTSDARTITLSMSPNASTFTCSNNLSHAAVAGEATFTGCVQSKAASSPYTLTADDGSGGLAAITTTFTVISGPASALALCWGTASTCNTTAPTGFTGGTIWPSTVQPQARVVDSSGNLVATDSSTYVTLGIASGTPTSGTRGTLTCTSGLTVRASGGLATFAGCTIDRAATGYKLIATSSPSYASSTSNAFNVSVGPATKLAFTAQPNAGTAGQPFPIQPVVAVQDAGGNTVASGTYSNATVVLALGANPGGGTLTCTGGTTRAAVSGTATFGGCGIDRQGAGYTLTAVASGLQSAVTSAFSVTAPAAQITLTSSASVITWGSGVVLTTHFAVNGAYKAFVLQASANQLTWTAIATLTTDSHGNASLYYRPATNLYYRATHAGAPDLLAGNSNTVRVVVRQIALLRPTSSGRTSNVSTGTNVAFTTTVRPARPELAPARVTYVIYRLVGGRWIFFTQRNLYIDSRGIARLTWRFSAGDWYVRSIARPTSVNANSVWSRVERYHVG